MATDKSPAPPYSLWRFELIACSTGFVACPCLLLPLLLAMLLPLLLAMLPMATHTALDTALAYVRMYDTGLL